MRRPPRRKKPDAPTKDMQWDDAIKRVLSEADRALHYTEIAERIISE